MVLSDVNLLIIIQNVDHEPCIPPLLESIQRLRGLDPEQGITALSSADDQLGVSEG